MRYDVISISETHQVVKSRFGRSDADHVETRGGRRFGSCVAGGEYETLDSCLPPVLPLETFTHFNAITDRLIEVSAYILRADPVPSTARKIKG